MERHLCMRMPEPELESSNVEYWVLIGEKGRL